MLLETVLFCFNRLKQTTGKSSIIAIIAGSPANIWPIWPWRHGVHGNNNYFQDWPEQIDVGALHQTGVSILNTLCMIALPTRITETPRVVMMPTLSPLVVRAPGTTSDGKVGIMTIHSHLSDLFSILFDAIRTVPYHAGASPAPRLRIQSPSVERTIIRSVLILVTWSQAVLSR